MKKKISISILITNMIGIGFVISYLDIMQDLEIMPFICLAIFIINEFCRLLIYDFQSKWAYIFTSLVIILISDFMALIMHQINLIAGYNIIAAVLIITIIAIMQLGVLGYLYKVEDYNK